MKLINLSIVAISLLVGCSKTSNTPAGKVDSAPATSAAKTPTTASAKSYDGPFGLAMGISPTELAALNMLPNEAAPGIYFGSPPKHVDGIDRVVAQAAPKTGLCKILASTDVPVVNDSGDQVKAAVDKLAETVATKYGPNFKKIAYVGTGTYQRNPDMWMIGLKEDSVVYAYNWSGEKANLPNDLQEIEIFATASRISSAVAQVRYTFKNTADCDAEFKASKAANM